MEWIVRKATGRNLMILIILLLCAVFASRFKEYPLRRYHEWRYPPQKGLDALGVEILSSLDKQDSLRLRRHYHRVRELLSLSRSEGFEISDLEAAARKVLELDIKGKRARAVELLYRIELDIPRRKKQYIPVNAPELTESDLDKMAPAPGPRRKSP